MPKLSCPNPTCEWESQDFPAEFAAVANTTLEFHLKQAHSPAQPAAQAPHPPALKLKPPQLSTGSTPDQWSAFMRQWSMYKTGMAIPAVMHATALFHCCDDDLKTDLMRDIQDDVASMPEADLLKAIQRLAVMEERVMS